jgi:hypothetical protein
MDALAGNADFCAAPELYLGERVATEPDNAAVLI